MCMQNVFHYDTILLAQSCERPGVDAGDEEIDLSSNNLPTSGKIGDAGKKSSSTLDFKVDVSIPMSDR